MTLKLLAIGGLGNMLGPSAKHLADKKTAHYLRILDRGSAGEKKDALRAAWQQHGATLVASMAELVADGDFDGIVICAGKNGDDCPIFQELLPLLAKINHRRRYFILHLSTVSCDFVKNTYRYCAQHEVDYVNYPLTGGVKGSEAASMLILASGNETVYTRLLPMLERIGQPKYFGAAVEQAAAVKLIGHVMVFHGLLGLSLAIALQKQVFNLPALEQQQVEFFDFLNKGAGGTHQWEFSVRPGLSDNQWSRGFLIRHAVIDAIYTAQLLYEQKLPITLILPLLEVILLFSYILNHYSKPDLTTQAVTHLLATTPQTTLDDYLRQHLSFDFTTCMNSCIATLPKALQNSLMLTVSYPA